MCFYILRIFFFADAYDTVRWMPFWRLSFCIYYASQQVLLLLLLLLFHFITRLCNINIWVEFSLHFVWNSVYINGIMESIEMRRVVYGDE